ncbi:MAG: hypothetical protein QOE05_3455 [Actinomycetota bacterium]|jgi:hypothetical protein|nr:hypothetical protein [Actinomycetota bacterium]
MSQFRRGDGRCVVDLKPRMGDGFLTQPDVEEACWGLPADAPVLFVLSETQSFSGSAAAWTGRRFAACPPAFQFAAFAWACGPDFEAAVLAAAHRHVDFEGGRLAAGH